LSADLAVFNGNPRTYAALGEVKTGAFFKEVEVGVFGLLC